MAVKFTEDTTSTLHVIDSYEAGELTVNGRQYRENLIISAEMIKENWDIEHIRQLTTSHLQPLLDTEPEVIIIGTGLQLAFPPVENYGEVMNHGIGVEFMDTGAACRTYNVLVSEGRKVCAGLILGNVKENANERE